MNRICLIIFLSFCMMTACTHKVETKSEVALAPVEIKPIHITIDVNVKIDRAIDDYFKELE